MRAELVLIAAQAIVRAQSGIAMAMPNPDTGSGC